MNTADTAVSGSDHNPKNAPYAAEGK